MTMPAQPAPAPAVPINGKPASAKPADAAVAQGTPKVGNVAPVRERAGDRAARLKEKLESEEGPVATGDDGEPLAAEAQPKTERAATAEAPAAPADDARTRAAEERRQRLEKFRADEQKKQSERQERKGEKEALAEVERLRKRVSELEPNEQVFSSEEALLAAAERRGMTAEKLVQWMRTRLTDPNAVSQRHAELAKTESKSEIDKVREETRQQIEAIKAEREQEKMQREAVDRATRFTTTVTEAAETHPLTAAFMAKHGGANLVGLANAVVLPHLPDNYELGTLHDHLEQYLEFLQVGGAPSAAPAPATPANGPSHTSSLKNGAAKPVTTLGNDLASERASVIEEVPLHRLSKDERVERLKAKLRDA